jgi:hypothetical protein
MAVSDSETRHRAFANKRQVDREVSPETTLKPSTRFPKRGTEVSNAETMTKAIYQGFILRKDAYKLPARFAMPIVAGNRVVREVLAAFLAHPDVVITSKDFTPDARRTALSDY